MMKKWRRSATQIRILLLLAFATSCSSFSTGSGSSGEGKEAADAGSNDATPASPGDSGSSTNDEGGIPGGGCLQSFASHFTGTVPAFDGFHRDATFGDQGTLDLVSAIGTGGRGADGVLKIDIATTTEIRGRSLVRDVFVGSGPRPCATAKVDVHMRIVVKVLKHPSGGEAVLVMGVRFDRKRDLLIGLNPSGNLEVAQQDLLAQTKIYDTLGLYPLSLGNWHTIEVSLTYPDAGNFRVDALVNSQVVNIQKKTPINFQDPREFHVGALYAHPAANAAYEIDEASIF
jgi:hypothetical protein